MKVQSTIYKQAVFIDTIKFAKAKEDFVAERWQSAFCCAGNRSTFLTTESGVKEFLSRSEVYKFSAFL